MKNLGIILIIVMNLMSCKSKTDNKTETHTSKVTDVPARIMDEVSEGNVHTTSIFKLKKVTDTQTVNIPHFLNLRI